MKTRRSVRKFKPDMPSHEALEKIIEAGLYAASGKGLQSSMIVAITDKTLRDRLMEMNRVIGGWAEGFDPFFGAPAVLLVLADKSSANHVYDGSLTMGNMMLAAHALGLGSCWINRAREEFDSRVNRQEKSRSSRSFGDRDFYFYEVHAFAVLRRSAFASSGSRRRISRK